MAVCLNCFLQILQNSDEKVALSGCGALSNILTGLAYSKDVIGKLLDMGLLK